MNIPTQTITIVTICLNQAQYVAEAINSVLTQQYPGVHYIVIDAGSTDGSREIIARFSDDLAAVVFERDEGPADGLNKGLSRATSDIFGYLNADDILLPGSLRFVGEQFASNSKIDVLIGDGVELDSDGNIVGPLLSTPWSFSAFKFGQCPVVQPATFFRRSALSKTGGFNAGNHTCWDSELLADLALVGANIVSVPAKLAGFRLHPDSISGSQRLKAQYLSDCDRIFRKVVGRRRRQSDDIVAALYWLRRVCMRPQYLINRARKTFGAARQ